MVHTDYQEPVEAGLSPEYVNYYKRREAFEAGVPGDYPKAWGKQPEPRTKLQWCGDHKLDETK